jgi:hypothetical protein
MGDVPLTEEEVTLEGPGSSAAELGRTPSAGQKTRAASGDIAGSDQSPLWERLGSSVQPLAGVVGAAGAAAFVYLLGGAVMWLRFNRAGVPADHVVSVLPHELLVIVGVKEVILPAVAAAAVAATIGRLDKTLHAPAAVERKHRKMAAVGWPRIGIIVVLCAVVLLTVPLTRGGVAYLLAFVLFAGYYTSHLRRSRRLGCRLSRPRLIGSAILLVALAVVAREWTGPSSLERAEVITEDDKKLAGSYISSDSEIVYLWDGIAMTAVPKQRVKQISLQPAVAPRQPTTLIERFLERLSPDDLPEVRPAQVTATSELAQHPSDLLFDGSMDTYWAADRPSEGTTPKLTVTFPKALNLYEIAFIAGAPDPEFATYARPRRIRVTAAARAAQEWDLDDTPGFQGFAVELGRVSSVRIEILSVYPARSDGNGCAITEMQFFAG